MSDKFESVLRIERAKDVMFRRRDDKTVCRWEPRDCGINWVVSIQRQQEQDFAPVAYFVERCHAEMFLSIMTGKPFDARVNVHSVATAVRNQDAYTEIAE